MYRGIRLEALATSPQCYGEVFSESAQMTEEQWVQRAESTTGYLAVVDGNVVGMLAVNEDVHWLPMAQQLFVSPAVRGMGVTAALFDAAFAQFGRISLLCWKSNDAGSRAFKRLGFAPIEDRGHAYVMATTVGVLAVV